MATNSDFAAPRPEFPQLRLALAGDDEALAALARLEAAFAPPEEPEILTIPVSEISRGDDLFGAGIVTRAYYVGSSVRVEYGDKLPNGTSPGATFWPDEEVTVRRATE